MKVRLVNVSKRFISLRGSLLAVDGVNLEIQDGEFFVLLGPSGSGKSTVLNLIAGLEKPTSGEIRFDDRTVASREKKIFLTPRERNVAFVFQSYALYPHLNVLENISFPLQVQRMPKRQMRESAQKVASVLKISDLLMAKPRELSGGQRQRVAIARAIVRQPNLFLLDEPLSNLDPQLRLSTRRELKELQRSLGITTIYVTHDQSEAMSVGDRIAILKDGKLIQVGAPEKLYEEPVNPFVATFIGSPGMNLLKVSVREESGTFRITLGNRELQLPQTISAKLKKLQSRTCVLGIRPEHIAVNSDRPKQPFKVIIDAVEPSGRDQLLHVSINDVALSVLTSKGDFKKGNWIDIDFDLSKIHIFEI